MFERFTQDNIVAAALVDPYPFRVAAGIFPRARKQLLRIALFCESAKKVFAQQKCFSVERELWADDPGAAEAFTKPVYRYATDLIRAEGYAIDEGYFASLPPRPTREQYLATLDEERKRALSKAKALSSEIKELTKAHKPCDDKTLYAREYARYHRELRRIDAS